MSTYHPHRRTDEQRRKDADAMRNRICKCTHYDAITCSATLHKTTRFNVLATYGECYCACHLTDSNNPISEAAWQAGRRVVA